MIERVSLNSLKFFFIMSPLMTVSPSLLKTLCHSRGGQ